MENAFIQASRLQLRFVTNRGHIATEDLWALSLKSLDSLAVSVDEQCKPERKSFLENPDEKANTVQKENELRLEILKTVISIKQEENKAAYAAASNRRRKEILQELLEKKKIGELEGKSIEDLEAEIKALG